jgi:hypothetical protein
MHAKIEPRLLELLESTSSADELIDVVLSFEPPRLPASTSSKPLMMRREERASAVSKTIELALAHACEIAGTQPAEVTRFPLTGSAFVRAPRRYVRALLDQSEVAGAVLNSGSSIR